MDNEYNLHGAVQVFFPAGATNLYTVHRDQAPVDTNTDIPHGLSAQLLAFFLALTVPPSAFASSGLAMTPAASAGTPPAPCHK